MGRWFRRGRKKPRGLSHIDDDEIISQEENGMQYASNLIQWINTLFKRTEQMSNGPTHEEHDYDCDISVINDDVPTSILHISLRSGVKQLIICNLHTVFIQTCIGRY